MSLQEVSARAAAKYLPQVYRQPGGTMVRAWKALTSMLCEIIEAVDESEPEVIYKGAAEMRFTLAASPIPILAECGQFLKMSEELAGDFSGPLFGGCDPFREHLRRELAACFLRQQAKLAAKEPKAEDISMTDTSRPLRERVSQFINSHRATHDTGEKTICNALGISRSSYHSMRSGRAGKRVTAAFEDLLKRKIPLRRKIEQF